MATSPMTEEEPKPKGELALRTLAMPADTNSNGDIFGGWVMSQMDLAAGMTAGIRAHGPVATVRVNAMTFLKPVKVGDVVCAYVDIIKEGTTSLTLNVELWILRRNSMTREKVTEAEFIFVAIDENGIKRPLPPRP